jgi:hypothetical protein
LVSHAGEQLRLKVFENRVLPRIFGPSKDEATGCWRKPNNEKFRNLYVQSLLLILLGEPNREG